MTLGSDKRQKEIAMSEGGVILARIRKTLVQSIKLGVNVNQLEQLALKLIKENGAAPSFQLVPGYNYATCINLNQGVVHGIPRDLLLKESDLVTIDIGIFFRGFHTDSATTVAVGNLSAGDKKFLLAGKRALRKAINQAKAGNRVGHISQAIQRTIETAGYNCVQLLTGHGIGRKLHEEPAIPCILKTRVNQTPELRKGQTLAIEVIYTQGKPELRLKKDGWTYVTIDGSKAAVFEETVLITNNKPLVLTKEKD